MESYEHSQGDWNLGLTCQLVMGQRNCWLLRFITYFSIVFISSKERLSLHCMLFFFM